MLALSVLPATAIAGGANAVASPNKEAVHAVRWGLALAVLVEVVGIVVLTFADARVRTLLVGKDKRLSTSKTVAIVWTLVVGAALFAMVYADLHNHGKPLSATDAAKVVGQYAVLFGGPLGAAILAKTIVIGQVGNDASAKPQSVEEGVKLSQLVANDAGDTDLGDLQYVLFNSIALFFVLGMFIHNPLGGLPHIPDVLLGLTSVSAVGYVGKKMLPNDVAIMATFKPNQAKAEDNVTIVLTGLTPPGPDDMYFWVRFGPTDEGRPIKAGLTGNATSLTLAAPALVPAPIAPVPIMVVAEDGTVIKPEKEFTYEP